jgi:hypothetical protein
VPSLLQIRILEESGQLPLAYVAAASHGFEEEAARLRDVSAAWHEPLGPSQIAQNMLCALTAAVHLRRSSSVPCHEVVPCFTTVCRSWTPQLRMLIKCTYVHVTHQALSLCLPDLYVC